MIDLKSISKKIRVENIYNLARLLVSQFERGATPDDCDISLLELLDKNVNLLESVGTDREPNGKKTYCHIKTGSHSAVADWTNAQTFALGGYLNMYYITKSMNYLKKAEELGQYLLKHQEKNGLFLANCDPKGRQDEGIATFWAVSQLVELYKCTKNKQYLDSIIRAVESSRKFLFHNNSGYVHTLGETTWTTNANIAAAYATLSAYKETGTMRYLQWAREAVTQTIRWQRSDGLFLYAQKRQSIYVSMYHTIVMLLLMLYNKLDPLPDISTAIDNALIYQKKLERLDGSIKEPDGKHYSFCTSVSISIALDALTNDCEKVSKSINFLNDFFSKGKLYVFYKNNKLYIGTRKREVNNYIAFIFLCLSLAEQFKISNKVCGV